MWFVLINFSLESSYDVFTLLILFCNILLKITFNALHKMIQNFSTDVLTNDASN